MINLAVLGIGGYGWQLTQNILEVAEQLDTRIIAAADRRLKQLGKYAAQLSERGVELFDDAQELLTSMRGRCEAVYIATGIPSHLPLVTATAREGYHIHLEKPPAATVQETDQIIRAIDEAAVMCMLGFHSLHGKEMQLLKDRILSGRLGKINTLVSVGIWPRSRRYYTRNDWAGKLRSSGRWVLDGPATNAMAHQTNDMLFLASGQPGGFASPTEVRAELYAAGRIESHDTAAIEILTAEGAKIYLFATHCGDDRSDPNITVYGEKGRALWDMKEGVTIDYADGGSEEFGADVPARHSMIRNFIEAVRTEDSSKLLSRPRDARKSVLVGNGAHESSGEIHRIPGTFTRRLEEGTDRERAVVEGLDEYFLAGAREQCLLSELKSPPQWAKGGTPFKLDGYESFPQRFRPD
jgi:predicted dehydrogenase